MTKNRRLKAVVINRPLGWQREAGLPTMSCESSCFAILDPPLGIRPSSNRCSHTPKAEMTGYWTPATSSLFTARY